MAQDSGIQDRIRQDRPPTAVDGLPQIALTKTIPPSANKFRIERRRLLDMLQDAASYRLILIKAPAGYGKTTLAVDWCEQLRRSGATVAWLSVDDDDNESTAFAYHIAKTIHRAAPEVGQRAISLLAETKLIASRSVVSAAINSVAEADEDVYLFLDDYHLVTDHRTHELTTFLLRYAPSNFHLVIMSRTEPQLSLSKLRLADEVAEIDVANLRFTLDETGQFLGGELGPKLEAGDISKLHDATEGWPAALQLARISVRNSTDPSATVRSFSGASRKISAYIEDTLATQADEIVQFLLQTAILDRLHGSLCQAVTGIARSAELLKALDHEQLLLVTLDEGAGWYRYHHLMSDFLLDRLHARMADRIPELHRRAYRWYASQQMWTHAVQHAIAAKDFDQALRLVEQCGMLLIGKGDFLTLLAWERHLPVELMAGQTQVKLLLAWGMMLVTRFKESDALLKQVEEKTQGDKTSELWWRCRVARGAWYALSDDSANCGALAAECPLDIAYDAFSLASIPNILRYGHLRAARWDDFYSQPIPTRGDDEATYVLAENYRLCLYGMAAAQRLQLDDALRYYEEARLLAVRYVGSKSVSATMTIALLALPQYERGDTSAAEIAVLDELDVIETSVYHESFLSAYLIMARTAVARGDISGALRLLKRGERLAGERGWPRPVASLLLERARIMLREKRPQDFPEIVAQLHQLKSNYPAPARASWTDIHISAAAVDGLHALAEGRSHDAIGPLRWAYEELLASDNKFGALRVGMEFALALQQSDNSAKAIEIVRQVIGWAAAAGAVSFARERPDFDPLLSSARADPVLGAAPSTRAYIERLLGQKRGAGSAASQANGPGPKQALSEREQAIVGYIANGQSNKQITRTLGVTPETVKTHVKRIFIKLSAESRTQAVIRAQSLGYLATVTVR